MSAAAAFGTRIARKGAKRTKTFRVFRPFREFRGSQLPLKRLVQQCLEEVLRLALGSVMTIMISKPGLGTSLAFRLADRSHDEDTDRSSPDRSLVRLVPDSEKQHLP